MNLERHEAPAPGLGLVPGSAPAEGTVEHDAPAAGPVAQSEVAPTNPGSGQQESNHCGPVNGASLPTNDPQPVSPQADDSACTPAIISQNIGRVRRHGRKKGKHQVSGRRRIVSGGVTYTIEMMHHTLRIRKFHSRKTTEVNLVAIVDMALGQFPLL